MGAADLATVVRRRFPSIDATLEADLVKCEETAWGETATPREALKLIQALHAHQEQLNAAAKPGRGMPKSESIQSVSQERVS